jgi:hypothetical protein
VVLVIGAGMAAMVATATGGAFFFESAAAAVDVAVFLTASNCAFTRALFSLPLTLSW